MTKIIEALEMCKENKVRQSEEVKKIAEYLGHKPLFVIINASDDAGNARYIEGKNAEGTDVGLDVHALKFESDCTNNDILKVINYCNNNRIPVILQLPTFKHLDTELLLDSIDYSVDADCFNKLWLGELAIGNDKNLAPATPKGVIQILEYNNIDLVGKNALVIGKSNHVGKPLAVMMMNRGATLLNANSKTKDLNSLVAQADIIISCVGRLDLFNTSYIKKDAVLIGVGFTYVGRKQILDFDLDNVMQENKASLVSNRINCTGKATINALIDNVIELYKLNYNIK